MELDKDRHHYHNRLYMSMKISMVTTCGCSLKCGTNYFFWPINLYVYGTIVHKVKRNRLGETICYRD
jgi:hypothetical protein